MIWSDFVICPICKTEFSFWDIAVQRNPLSLLTKFKCTKCNHKDDIVNLEKVTESTFDNILNKTIIRKKRMPVWVHGKTGKLNWSRSVTNEDIQELNRVGKSFNRCPVPVYEIDWGVLFRKGYHAGITHLHHFYTERNLIVFSHLWNKVLSYPEEFQKGLKLLLLSYNSSHSTLMSRVVIKQGGKDFVITSAQSGVLYIGSIPVEKNILEGLKRKITTFTKAFEVIEKSRSTVSVFNTSSTTISEPENSIDYIFTDPPFGAYIPYSEINQLNEAWLGRLTNIEKEVIINSSQKKSIDDYEQLMTDVFKEAFKVLKNDGKISLVFHSSQSNVWRALVNSYENAGFVMEISSILDKIQGSFKQVTSKVKVQGDPLLMLSKGQFDYKKNNDVDISESTIIQSLLDQAFVFCEDLDERKPERLFSRYINACIANGVSVSTNATEFFDIISKKIPQLQSL